MRTSKSMRNHILVNCNQVDLVHIPTKIPGIRALPNFMTMEGAAYHREKVAATLNYFALRGFSMNLVWKFRQDDMPPSQALSSAKMVGDILFVAFENNGGFPLPITAITVEERRQSDISLHLRRLFASIRDYTKAKDVTLCGERHNTPHDLSPVDVFDRAGKIIPGNRLYASFAGISPKRLHILSALTHYDVAGFASIWGTFLDLEDLRVGASTNGWHRSIFEECMQHPLPPNLKSLHFEYGTWALFHSTWQTTAFSAPNLEHFSLHCFKFSGVGLRDLGFLLQARKKVLKSLSMTACEISRSSMNSLASTLSEMDVLTHLDLTDTTGYGGDAVHDVVKALEQSSSIQEVRFSGLHYDSLSLVDKVQTRVDGEKFCVHPSYFYVPIGLGDSPIRLALLSQTDEEALDSGLVRCYVEPVPGQEGVCVLTCDEKGEYLVHRDCTCGEPERRPTGASFAPGDELVSESSEGSSEASDSD